MHGTSPKGWKGGGCKRGPGREEYKKGRGSAMPWGMGWVGFGAFWGLYMVVGVEVGCSEAGVTCWIFVLDELCITGFISMRGLGFCGERGRERFVGFG